MSGFGEVGVAEGVGPSGGFGALLRVDGWVRPGLLPEAVWRGATGAAVAVTDLGLEGVIGALALTPRPGGEPTWFDGPECMGWLGANMSIAGTPAAAAKLSSRILSGLVTPNTCTI